jgi:hypothetical protein
MSAPAPTEIDILAQAIETLDSPESAQIIKAMGSLRLPVSALDHVDHLLEKNRSGSITPEERAELEKYLRVGNFLDLMRAWATRREHLTRKN